MVAQSVLRAARLVAAGTALAVAWLGAPEASQAEEKAAVLVDLRPEPEPDGGELARALAGIPGLALRDEPALQAALAAAPAPGTAAAGSGELAAARAAYGQLDCELAQAAAGRAALHFAAARAADPASGELADSLERAHVYELLCADSTDDLAAGQLAAERLRSLGAERPPEGVSAEVWERFPEIDATTDVRRVPLAITTEPEGAAVWVDHRPVGRAPAEALVTEGPRLVAAAAEARAGAAIVEVGAPSAQIELALGVTDGRWDSLRRAIAMWRDGREPTPMEMSNLLQRLDARVLIVRREDAVELWGRGVNARVAQELGELTGSSDAEVIAGEVGKRVAAWTPRRAGPEPGVPLLRENPEQRDADRSDDEPAWWVYASIAGAVALGAAFVIANDLADDRQRIELSWP